MDSNLISPIRPADAVFGVDGTTQSGERSNQENVIEERVQGDGDETEAFPLSYHIVQEAMKAYGPINRAAVAKAVGVTPPGFYYNVIGKRRWFVDTWLLALACLGRLKVRGDKIIVTTELAQVFASRAKRLAAESYEEGKPGK